MTTARTRDEGSMGSHRARSRDWAWRRRIRQNPQSLRIYRTVVATAGFLVVVLGLALVPLPGPGWLIVFLGVSIWASEFRWAKRLHRYGMGRLQVWNAWVLRQGWPVRMALAVATFLFVNAILWASLKLTGVPGWMPDQVESFLHAHLAL